MPFSLSNDFIVHSIPLLAHANCDVEEDPHVTLGHLGGSEKIEPILVSVLEQQGLRGRVTSVLLALTIGDWRKWRERKRRLLVSSIRRYLFITGAHKSPPQVLPNSRGS